jgi:hypothetical protein
MAEYEATKHRDMLAAGTRNSIVSRAAEFVSVSIQLLVLLCRGFDLSREAHSSPSIYY